MASKSNELADVSEDAFAVVARELATGKTDEALWTKAFALQNGDESATKAHYIRLRVEKLQQLNDSKAPDGNEQPRNTSRLTTKPAKTSEETVGEVSLWSRLWARNIDFLICMALFLPVSFLISAQSESLIFSFVIAFVVPGLILILYDAFLTSAFGKTIGKALFGIRVARVTGENLPFNVAWNRAFKVWAYGNSGYFVFPVLTLMTWWSARRGIQKTGTSSWDVAADSCVTQSNIGSFRNVLVTAFGVLCFVSAITISAAVKYTNKKVIKDSVIPTAEKSVPNNSSGGIDFSYHPEQPKTDSTTPSTSGPWMAFRKQEVLDSIKDGTAGYAIRAWSGNAFDQFDSVEQITQKALSHDVRLRDSRVWSAVQAWQNILISVEDLDPNEALYQAVDSVLLGLKENNICYPNTDFDVQKIEETNGRKPKRGGKYIIFSKCSTLRA